jgi:hypothetical protein
MEKNRSKAQQKQVRENTARSGKKPEAPGFDKKLDGENRPST